MAIQIASTRISQCNNYKGLGTYLGLVTNAGSPGTGTTPSNEATGGAYVRVATTWGSPSDNGTTASVVGSAVTISANAATYSYSPLCTAATAGTMIDWGQFGTPIVLSLAGQIVVTPTYSQT